jgi:hypothetical protein
MPSAAAATPVASAPSQQMRDTSNRASQIAGRDLIGLSAIASRTGTAAQRERAMDMYTPMWQKVSGRQDHHVAGACVPRTRSNLQGAHRSKARSRSVLRQAFAARLAPRRALSHTALEHRR